jgi:hypothetical protein
MPDRRASQHRAHDERFTASKDRLILLLQLIVSGKRGALQPVADELDRPGGNLTYAMMTPVTMTDQLTVIEPWRIH